jgi:FtsZ-binding cell division protein ZapB
MGFFMSLIIFIGLISMVVYNMDTINKLRNDIQHIKKRLDDVDQEAHKDQKAAQKTK